MTAAIFQRYCNDYVNKPILADRIQMLMKELPHRTKDGSMTLQSFWTFYARSTRPNPALPWKDLHAQKYRNDFSRSDSVLPTYVLAPRSCRVTFEAEDEEEEFLSQVMALTKLDDAARVIIAVSRYRYIDAAKFIELGMNSPQGYSHVLS